MNTIKTNWKLGALLLAVLYLSGCLYVDVIDNVKNPERYFREAYREIAQIPRSRIQRKHRSEQLHVLVYERSERKIVKIILPVGIVDSCSDLEHWIEEEYDEFGFEKRYDLKKYKLNRNKFRNLQHKSPGYLAEFKDKDSKVLIWLK
ncbi:MAG: hypothetical protein MUP98_17455 [Candidatus Aminicenantes bacterium]|nr:hypothetical protein [Candidatus Aminicenantes bacterium]